MKTVVAETVLLGREAFETLGEVEVIPDREICADHLKDVDLLVIRSKTKATPALLDGSSVRFVGTATAGFEHLDADWLKAQGIGWTASPGCNANSVADYITTALLRLNTELEGKTIGIIGVGQVGHRVAKRAAALGLTVLLNDPPRAEIEGDTAFTPLDDLLKESDFVTLHTPLIKDGPRPTHHLADDAFFDQMKPGAAFLNAARGPITDSDALLRAKAAGKISHAILDVWTPEPCIRTDVVEQAHTATAHIAGHSLEGKLNGTVQVYAAACAFLNLTPNWNPALHLPALDVPTLTLDPTGKSDQAVLREAVDALYDQAEDDRLLRLAAVCDDAQRAKLFDATRGQYAIRREFFNTTIQLTAANPELEAKLSGIGFSVTPYK